MKPVLIVENSVNSLTLENTSTKRDYILSGIFTEFGVKNRNDRIYTADKFLPALNELNERINNLGVVYGEFDHPDVFDTSLSRASHIVAKAEYIRERNLVTGEIKLLSTYWGREAKALVNDGCPVFVSSRAAGITEADGSVALKKLFTYDIVADPGFSSAKMSIKVLNESLGYNTRNSNFRIYEMSDDTKINELFNMNKNDFVTKKQLTDYSQYLVNELSTTKRDVKTAISKGNLAPKKLEQLLEYYEELNNTNQQVVKYLDYLADKIQVVVNENKTLKTKTDRLVRHNDYLAENLERSINYSEYLGENLEKNIKYGEYIAENLDRNIQYSEYIAENLDRNIQYSEYIAENLDRNIKYSEYIAENLDNNILYSEYLAENLDNSIEYSEYLAENVDTNIAYSEYLAEHVDGNIAYAEYLAEHVDGNIAYSEYLSEHLEGNIDYTEYVAENLDKSIGYQAMITEKINKSRVNENAGGYYPQLPSPEDAGFVQVDNEMIPSAQFIEDDFMDYDDDLYFEPNSGGRFRDSDFEMDSMDKTYLKDDCDECGNEYDGSNDTELSESINKLINEAKKRKVSETSDLNFLKFLNKSQVDSFYSLSRQEQEAVKLHINERSYFTQKEVLTLVNEALSAKGESLEERVIRLMPENIKPVWGRLNESTKRSVLSQARLYPEDVMRTDEQVEHFWLTRNFKKNESTKKLVEHTPLIQEDKINDREASAILERFKNI
jgi:hypothetical protein